MSALSISPATAADAETIVANNAAMALETEGRRLDAGVLARGVQRVLSDPARGVYYAARRGGTVVGQMLITREWSDWRDGWFWWIQSVYVSPSARGEGVYRELHAWVERLARETPGVCGLRLYVDAQNRRAQEVYRAMGMTRTDYLLFETDWSGAPPHGG